VKRWFHVPVAGVACCGRCRVMVVPGEVVLVYVGATWQKFRCVACAGEPAPAAADVPPLPATRDALREWTDPL
jgi:hypothetical protein